jgi:MFS family permease
MQGRSRRGRLGNSLFSSLRYRDNRVFWIGTSLSSVGQSAFLVAAVWLASGLGGGGAAGLVTFAVMAPFLIATPIGGLLADRYDRRAIVLGAQAVQGVVALVLGALALLDLLPLAVLVAFVLLTSIARTIELPTVGAALPSLVPQRELLNTLSLNTLATIGSRLVGAGLLAPVLKFGGAGPAFLMIAALYPGALVWVRRVPPMPRGALAAVGLAEQVREGGRYIARHGIIGLLLAITILHCWLAMSYDSTLPLFATESLDGSGDVYALLSAAIGAGAIAGSLLLAGLKTSRWRGMLLLGTGLGSGLGTALLAPVGVWPLALVVCAAMAAAQSMFMTLSTMLVQETTPDALRGRVTGLFLSTAGGIMAFGNLVNGYLSERFSPPPVLALTGLAYIVALLAVSGAYPALRRVYARGALTVEPAGAVTADG